MKLKNISVYAFASIMLVLFIPVFACIIVFGSKMNYYDAYKIVTMAGNKVLLVCALAGALIFFLCYCLLKRIPYNRHTVTGATVMTFAACILFYFMKVNISKCIAFYGGWDCGMVANSARWVYEGQTLGYDDYYTIFSNNVPITWLLYKLYSISSGLADYPYNPEFIWIQFQCVMFSAALFCSVMTVLLISRKIAAAVLALLVNFLFLGLSPWQIIPYTDGSTIAVPILMIFLYTLFLQFETKQSKWKFAVWSLMGFVGFLGGIMKATCYVTLIAILIVDTIWLLSEGETVLSKMRKVASKSILLLCGFMLAASCKYGMYETLDYEYDPDLQISWRSFLYDGLNKENTGTCSEDGMNIAREFAGRPEEERIAYETQCIKERVLDMGAAGLLYFWLKKQVMSYNDGTFTWFQEGFFNAWEYEDITDSSWKQPLRDFYWKDGKYYLLFTTLSQTIWLFLLLGCILEAGRMRMYAVSCAKKGKDDTEMHSQKVCIRTIGILVFIGVFLFVMLFEGRARYLYNHIPVFSTMALIGYCELAERICLQKKTNALRKMIRT